MTHPTEGIIATSGFCWRHWRTIFFLSRTLCHGVIDFAHSWLFGAGFVGFRRRGRRRSGPCRKRALLVRAFIARANCPVWWQQLLLRRGVERPRLVSVRRPVELWFWLDRPLQPQHLWRLRDPAPSSPWRSRFLSPGAEPRLPPPRAASAARRGPRRAVRQSAFRPRAGLWRHRQPRLASLWRRRRCHLA